MSGMWIKMTSAMFIAGALTFAIAQNDPGGWGKARWGMTKEQLRAQVGARFVPQATHGSLKTQFGVDFDLNSIPFRAYFFVDDVFGLSTVLLMPADRQAGTITDFQKLEKELAAKYGTPRNRKVESDKGVTAVSEWVLRTTTIRLSFVNVKGGIRDDKGQWRPIHARSLDIVYKRTGADKL